MTTTTNAIIDALRSNGSQTVRGLTELTGKSRVAVNRYANKLAAAGNLIIVSDNPKRFVLVETVTEVKQDKLTEQEAKLPGALKLSKDAVELLGNILFSNYNGDHAVDYPVWTWDVCEGFGTSAGGLVAGLVDKGLVVSHEDGKDSTLQITKAGVEQLVLRNLAAESADFPGCYDELPGNCIA